MSEYQIRENIPQYIEELRAWLQTQENVPLEEMSAFFTVRITDYEEHMQLWAEGYRHIARLIPKKAKTLLDLGCGTGLELYEILALRPELYVTGVDLSKAMLEKLEEKHPGVDLICGDYFQVDLGKECYDCAVSFESLHHFLSEKKQGLYQKLFDALKPGGEFLLVDYLAACQEEEDLMMDFRWRKRREQGIPEEQFVHFDTPLTVEHEMDLLKNAGFSQVEWLCAIEGASFLRCKK